MDERDIEPVVHTLRRVAHLLVEIRIAAQALPDTPGWQGPTRWVVDRRVEGIHHAIDTCHRFAEASHLAAEDDLQRARRRAEQQVETGIWL